MADEVIIRREKVMVEATGMRKHFGPPLNIDFVPQEGWVGDVAYLDKEIADSLVKAETQLTPDHRYFRYALKDEPVEKELTKDQIAAQLKERGVEFNITSKKAELQELLDNAIAADEDGGE